MRARACINESAMVIILVYGAVLINHLHACINYACTFNKDTTIIVDHNIMLAYPPMNIAEWKYKWHRTPLVLKYHVIALSISYMYGINVKKSCAIALSYIYVQCAAMYRCLSENMVGALNHTYTYAIAF